VGDATDALRQRNGWERVGPKRFRHDATGMTAEVQAEKGWRRVTGVRVVIRDREGAVLQIVRADGDGAEVILESPAAGAGPEQG
jgi:hypothetical protein